MTLQDMTDEQRAVLDKVEKLLRLAGGSTTEAEAASATKKANDLMLAYNLSASALGSGGEGARGQEKLKGGFYQYQQDLMARLADVNFCRYWTSRDWVKREGNLSAKVRGYRDSWRRAHQLVFHHHLVGRRINVEATLRTYYYLNQTIERLTREFIAPGSTTASEVKVEGLAGLLRSRRAVSYREGVASSVSDKLWERRQDQIAEEQKEAAKMRRQAEEARAAGTSSATALTISSLRQSEREANDDFLYGEGWTAENRRLAAERAAKLKAAEEAYTVWAAAHPEEAAKQEKERLEEARKAARRGPGSRGGGGRAERERDWGAYSAGTEAGKRVGIDPQAEHSSAPRKIAGRVG